MDAPEIYIVLDDDFNRTHYPRLIGETYTQDKLPSYVKIKSQKRLVIEIWAELDRIFNEQKKPDVLLICKNHGCPNALADRIISAWATTLQDTPPDYLFK